MAKPPNPAALVPTARITQAIVLLRGHKVLLDSVLAALYGVSTRVLNQAVKRNHERFPEDFMFQLSWKEAENLRSQNVILDRSSPRSQNVTLKRGSNLKYRPYAFTEQGVAMLSSVLRSAQAVQGNIAIMRAFVQLREAIAGNKELASKLEELERRIERKLASHDHAIAEIQTRRPIQSARCARCGGSRSPPRRAPTRRSYSRQDRRSSARL